MHNPSPISKGDLASLNDVLEYTCDVGRSLVCLIDNQHHPRLKGSDLAGRENGITETVDYKPYSIYVLNEDS